MGTFDFLPGIPYEVKAWARLTNGEQDMVHTNDTLTRSDHIGSFAGIYTIGGEEADFENFTSAVNALHIGGVVDSVNFLVRPDTYFEQLTIREIPRAATDRRITFQSESEIKEEVILSFLSENNQDNFTLLLDEADYITFRNMTLRSEGPLHGTVVDIRNDANQNALIDNLIEGPIETTSNGDILIWVTSSDIKIKGNVIRNGKYGISDSESNLNPPKNGLSIEQNRFENQYHTGIILHNHHSPQIVGNIFDGDGINEAYPANAIYLSDALAGTRILNNHIHLVSKTGINILSAEGSEEEPVLIANNFVNIGASTNGNLIGIRIALSEEVDVFHNTVRITATNNKVFQAQSGASIRLINNIFVNTGGGYVIYTNKADNITISDYNVLLGSGTKLFRRASADLPDLASWQAATGFEEHSLSVDPMFLSDTDLHVAQPMLNTAGVPLLSVSKDIDGEMRDPNSPDIGADEFIPGTADDAGITQIIHPVPAFPSGDQEVQVVLRNFGADPLTSATIHWIVNDESQAAYYWAGNLASGQIDSVSISHFNFAPVSGYDLMAWTESPNGQTDLVTFNDTLNIPDLYPALEGIYTIGGTAPDFPDFTTAVDALNHGGVIGPVTFQVRPGVYTEQLSIGKIPGSSTDHPVVFVSEEMDSSSVILQFGGNSSNDFLLRFDGTSYLSIRNISLVKTSTGSVIEIYNGSHHLAFENNHIAGKTSFSSLNTHRRAVIYMEASPLEHPEYISITGNHIKNGTYAVYYRDREELAPAKGIKVENNRLNNQYWTNLYFKHLDAPQIIDNIFEYSTNREVIKLHSCKNDYRILGNRILRSDPASGASNGIDIESCESTSEKPGLIANNFLHIEGTFTRRGISLYASDYVHIFHNNILLTNTSENSSNLAGGGSHIRVLNNVLVNSGGGMAMNFYASADIESDHNNILVTGELWGKITGAAYPSLDEWRAGTGHDLVSISVDPLFRSSSDLHIRQPALDSIAVVLPEIALDIDGEERHTTHPDIGADEVIFPGKDIGVSALVHPMPVSCGLDSTAAITVNIHNYGKDPQSNFDLAYTLNDTFLVIENVGNMVVYPGEVTEYTFTTTADLSARAEHRITSYSLLSDDADSSNDTLPTVTITNFEALTSPVSNMLPEDGSMDQDRPLVLSWSSVFGATHYNLYIWPEGEQQPVNPTEANLTQINYLYHWPNYATAYQWQVVAKNACVEIPGPIQDFTIRDLPDLVVQNLEVPNTAFSGQSIEINWEVINQGNGSSRNDAWSDIVYLSTEPNLNTSASHYLGTFPNLSALSQEEGYSRSASVLLPQNAVGEYYLYVITDRFHQIEETDNYNNTTRTNFPLSINLTPPPDLQVSAITNPSDAFSGQQISVNWEVTNSGTGHINDQHWKDLVFLSSYNVFNPNSSTFLGSFDWTGDLEVDGSYSRQETLMLPPYIEGEHYIYIVTDYDNEVYEFVFEDNNLSSATLHVILTPPADLVLTTLTAPERASNDQIIPISWTVQNQGGAAAVAYSWLDRGFFSPTPEFDPATAIPLDYFHHYGNLEVGAFYTQQQHFRIPANISGTYYMVVNTDVNNNIAEYTFEQNNTLVSDPIEILSCDLEAAAIVHPDSTGSGEQIFLQWATVNNGPGQVLNRYWFDDIFLSPTPSYHPDSVMNIGNKYNPGVYLSEGDSILHDAMVTIPNGISGTYYLGISVDARAEIFENGMENNNIQFSDTPIEVALSDWSDLVVTDLQVNNSASAGDPLSVSFIVSNEGQGHTPVNQNWYDRVYLSKSAVWEETQMIQLSQLVRSGGLASNSSYTQTANIQLPLNLSDDTYYFYIVTDASDYIYEHSSEGNNVYRSGPIQMEGYPTVDHAVVAASSPDTVPSGQQMVVAWTVESIGEAPNLAHSWYDAIFLSEDTILNDGDVWLGRWHQWGSMAPGTSYSKEAMVTIPNGLSGSYHLLILHDDSYQIIDNDRSNNLYPANSTGLTIQLTPPSDLQVTQLEVPVQGFAGQALELSFMVTNKGTGPTLPGEWTDRFFLSADFELQNYDLVIGSYSRAEPLSPGASYTATVQFDIPIQATGNLILLIKNGC